MKRFFANLGYWLVAICFVGLYSTLIYEPFRNLIWNSGYYIQTVAIILFFYPIIFCFFVLGIYLDRKFFKENK